MVRNTPMTCVLEHVNMHLVLLSSLPCIQIFIVPLTLSVFLQPWSHPQSLHLRIIVIIYIQPANV